MKWFKRMIINWVREDWDNAGRQPVESFAMTRGLGIAKSSTQSVDSDPTLTFKVYSAIGGKVVEFSRYDRKSDRADHQVYLIHKDEDFGEKISKIAMLENLR